LKRLDELIDFGFVHRVCRVCYAREVGRPAASPVMLFKMVLLQFLYDISDRRIVEEVRYHMAFKWFCGLEADGEPPHPTTLAHFRARLGPERFARIHNRIVRLAREEGLVSDRLSVVDATHVEARMNSYKVDDEDPPDPDARRGGRGGHPRQRL
jgi:transposase